MVRTDFGFKRSCLLISVKLISEIEADIYIYSSLILLLLFDNPTDKENSHS